jgi:hypothetical protein
MSSYDYNIDLRQTLIKKVDLKTNFELIILFFNALQQDWMPIKGKIRMGEGNYR